MSPVAPGDLPAAALGLHFEKSSLRGLIYTLVSAPEAKEPVELVNSGFQMGLSGPSRCL